MKHNLVKKKVYRKDGILTTVRVRVDKDKKLQKKKKLMTLMKRYNPLLAMLNKHIDDKGEHSLHALAIKTMILTGIRVGNEESSEGRVSKQTKSVEQTFGATTLTKEHVHINPKDVVLEFIGKKRVPQMIRVTNPKLRKQLEWAYGLPTKKLFNSAYKDLKRFGYNFIGKEYTPQDYRKLRANMEALKKIVQISKTPKPKTSAELSKEIKQIAFHVANVLGNTEAVAKSSYIDEDIITDFKNKRLKITKAKKKLIVKRKAKK